MACTTILLLVCGVHAEKCKYILSVSIVFEFWQRDKQNRLQKCKGFAGIHSERAKVWNGFLLCLLSDTKPGTSRRFPEKNWHKSSNWQHQQFSWPGESIAGKWLSSQTRKVVARMIFDKFANLSEQVVVIHGDVLDSEKSRTRLAQQKRGRQKFTALNLQNRSRSLQPKLVQVTACSVPKVFPPFLSKVRGLFAPVSWSPVPNELRGTICFAHNKSESLRAHALGTKFGENQWCSFPFLGVCRCWCQGGTTGLYIARHQTRVVLQWPEWYQRFVNFWFPCASLASCTHGIVFVGPHMVPLECLDPRTDWWRTTKMCSQSAICGYFSAEKVKSCSKLTVNNFHFFLIPFSDNGSGNWYDRNKFLLACPELWNNIANSGFSQMFLTQ